MPGDYSRKLFKPGKHYSGVLMQQGRTLLDADCNEQHEIWKHRTATGTKDVIGSCGVPKNDNGFKISIQASGNDLVISPGRIYVEGFLCQLDEAADQTTETTYFNQPYYPNPESENFIASPPLSPPESPPASPPESPPLSPPSNEDSAITSGDLALEDGAYIVYVDAWQREVNYLDDSLIQEVALGEADTTVRVQNVWQVKLSEVELTPGEQDPCKAAIDDWKENIAKSTGMMNARTTDPEDKKNPCLLPESAGYRRLENQLYRIEVHEGGERSSAKFKWSRDNASVETAIVEIADNVVTVSNTGKDEVLGFAADQWVEIVDEESTLMNMPNMLVQIEKVDPAAREITLKSNVSALIGKPKLKLKRWDHNESFSTAEGIPMTDDWSDIEGGIQVQFADGDSYYNPGDYWLIPARTATGEIEWPPYEVPNVNPVPQPHAGIYHHYCSLAVIEVSGGSATIHDCRALFPSLTEICAEDICFDNSDCSLPDVDTVQDALERLCSAQDLRLHNKYLHGQGVVCGLKVKCAPDRRAVIIEPGYALDCEGFGIHVKREIIRNIVSESVKKELLDNNGDGNVCLSIAAGGQNGAVISVEEHIPQDFMESVLEGTLLMDFYHECIESLILFLIGQFPTDLDDTPPVPVEQRRVTAILNLLSQLINGSSGPYAFLSGDTDSSTVDEDTLLRDFYQQLKDFLASETYCAMFDNDRPFPDYEIDQGLDTIFGSTLKFHYRLCLHPSLNFAYTCGAGNKIYVYDLNTRQLVQTLEFPSSSNILVQDIAVSGEGSKLYTVGIMDHKDSVFASASIAADGSHAWDPTSIECGIKYVTLATGPSPANKLYAIGKSQGLFDIDSIGLPAFTTTLVHAFNATGLIEISDDGSRVFAARNSVTPLGTEATSFNEIIEIDLTPPSGAPQVYAVQGDDSDNDVRFFNNTIYVTGDPVPGHTKTLWIINISSGSPVISQVDLLEDTITRLAVASGTDSGDFLLVTLADRSKVVRVDMGSNTLDTSFRIPVQIFPMDISVSSDGSTGYVLNPLVNTLTVIDIGIVFDPVVLPNYTLEPPIAISEYRQAVIDAFADLLGHFLQYLKDCFCDKFLVDCPECGGDDKVYLGCIEIRNNEVYNICNFTKRQYVKSFRTWGYWLSTVPILPLVKKSFAEFCCSVLNP